MKKQQEMDTEKENERMTLDRLALGASCVIRQVGNHRGAVKRRLVDMGLTPGTIVKLIKTAPMGDPMEVQLRGYELSLRKVDAAQIQVAPAGGEAEGVPEGAYHLGGGCSGDCSRCGTRAPDPGELEAMRRAHRHEQSQHPRPHAPRAQDRRQWRAAPGGDPHPGKTTPLKPPPRPHQDVGDWPRVTGEG